MTGSNEKLDLNSMRVIYNLKEAATLINSSINDLLKQAAQGKLKLCIRISRDDEVFNVIIKKVIPNLRDEKYIYFEGTVRYNRRILSSSFTMKGIDKVDALVISSTDCLELLRLGTIEQNQFNSGYCLSGSNSPRQVYPWLLRGYKEIDQDDRYYIVGIPVTDIRDLTPKRLSFGLDQVHVLANELDDWVDKVADENGELPTSIFTPHARTSLELIKLARAVQIFWSKTMPNATKLPTQSEIRRYLRNSKYIVGFSDHLAEAGANFICPPYGKRGYKPENQENIHSSTDYLSPQFLALIKLSNKYWGDPERKPILNKNMEDIIAEEELFADDSIRHAASIIRYKKEPRKPNMTKSKYKKVGVKK